MQATVLPPGLFLQPFQPISAPRAPSPTLHSSDRSPSPASGVRVKERCFLGANASSCLEGGVQGWFCCGTPLLITVAPSDAAQSGSRVPGWGREALLGPGALVNVCVLGGHVGSVNLMDISTLQGAPGLRDRALGLLETTAWFIGHWGTLCFTRYDTAPDLRTEGCQALCWGLWCHPISRRYPVREVSHCHYLYPQMELPGGHLSFPGPQKS